jgi:hypothetical protein
MPKERRQTSARRSLMIKQRVVQVEQDTPISGRIQSPRFA